MIVPIIINMKN